MSRQIELTVQGVVGTAPTLVTGDKKQPFCHFRLATTPTYRHQGRWHEGKTMWFTAKAFGHLAHNLAYSLHKGDPVLFHARLSQEMWRREEDGVELTTQVLTVVAGGHDLTRGTTRFARTALAPSDGAGARPEEGEQPAAGTGLDQAAGGEATARADQAGGADDPWACSPEDDAAGAPLPGCVEAVGSDADGEACAGVADPGYEVVESLTR